MKPKNLTDLIDKLPKQSYDNKGRPMEPVNLIIVGSAWQVRRRFKSTGWYLADRLKLASLIRSGWAIITNGRYDSGPFNNSYVLNKLQKYGFEKPTKSDKFRRRHHLRLWRTKYRLAGKRVWAGTLSYDQDIIISKSTMAPVHHISPSLSHEEEFLAHSLGVDKPEYVQLSKPTADFINTGDKFEWDGKALVIEL